ncbi:MAG: glycosyltransferase involved in cell wall biosynthesis [Psychromonas sp.]|jgi:glycosyltransferase involved in cell wall biosynthesis|uniref:glycosyltransferase family 2 protein n=1 Tax=Psychromonas sp. TaxID=1884585 RepID=UPI0039E63934
METKKVSVLIPTYNVENYIDEAIESIVNQSYKNIEIIIVDDASIDGTYKKLEAWALFDQRIKLFKNEKNSRIVKTLNFALTKATGFYVARMDGDDVSIRDRIEKLVLFLETNPEYSLVGSSHIGINEEGKEFSRTAMPSDFEKIRKTILLTSPVLHIWLAKKEVYDELNGYRADTVEDYDFLLRLMTKGYLFSNHPEFLYKVRVRGGNTRSTQGLKQAKAINYVKKLYKERKQQDGHDTYTDKSFEIAMKSSPLMEKIHKLSQFFLSKAVTSDLFLVKFCFAFMSAFISPYNAQYLFNRCLYRLKSSI